MINEEKQKILEYRMKHHRCRYCNYHRYIGKNFWGDGLHECIISKKTFFLSKSFVYNLKGCFCKFYEPKELTIDEI